MKDKARRKVVKKSVAAVLALPLLPESWQRPLVKAIVLPAHAQTSTPGPPSLILSTGLFAVESGPRSDSGGSPEPAIISITIKSCTNVSSTLNVSAIAGMSPSGSINLVDTTVTVAVDGTTSVIGVDAPVFAPVANVVSITINYSNDNFSYAETISGTALTQILTGSTTGFSC